MAKEKEVVKAYRVETVATQTEAVIVNEADEQKTILQVIAEIGNDVKMLKEKLIE